MASHIIDELCLDDLDDEDYNMNTVVHTSENNPMFKFSDDDDDNLDNVCKLQKSQHYKEVMNKVEDALLHHHKNNDRLVLEKQDLEYQLVIDCSTLLVCIENEIVNVHNIIRDIYRSKFPELESLVPHPIDYATVVKTIGNVTDLTTLVADLQGVLPSATIMVLSITALTTSGKPLQEESLKKAIHACNLALDLDLAKKKVLDFVETRMRCIAPNLSAIVGSVVAAKLLGIAGGLSALQNMPSCDVQLLGAKKKSFSSATSKIIHVGILEETEIFQTTPPSLRKSVCKKLANKSTLAARKDSNRGTNLTGDGYGRKLRDQIYKEMKKSQELPPAKQHKPLPVPDCNTKKKRGGRRFRKTKERYAVTKTRKFANRIQFGVPEESSLGDGLGVGYGLLGQSGSGKLRLPKGQTRRLGVKGTRNSKDNHFRISSGSSGLTTSLVFTPMQGIELINPLAHSDM
ncbi:hypothetical protein AQUCO_07700013v1 [Aquilegia coerulea]|uniref:Nop domain-containing protein n=1 Tax=Aquilegia coerulea TaxID=218851 RepID=A0A2G5C887_AQUCA|nr:hypothetical protein AQUCO_07700013v1 [Aquilegia coerulea]